MTFPYLDEGPEGDRIGLALSGGGVRAACLGLGALQAAEEEGILRETRFVSAVSGGSYIAAAYLASRAGADDRGAWSRGSPEEEHLRRNLRYLADGLGDLLSGLATYLRGLALNLLPPVAAIVVAATVAGLLLDTLGLLRATADGVAGPYGTQRRAAVALLLVAAFALGAAGRRRRPLRWAARACALAGAVGLVPDLLAVTTWVETGLATWVTTAAQLAVAVVLVLSTLALVVRTQWAVVGTWARRGVRTAVRTLFTASCVLAALSLFGLVTVWAAGGAGTALFAGAVAGVVLVACMAFVDANASSLHGMYADRLARAYVTRSDRDGADHRLDTYRMTDLLAPGVPQLVICAAVNLCERESAFGEGCASFSFSPTHVGSPALGYEPTGPFLERVGQLTLAELIAASGAAVAPNMGRFTQKTSRLALAMLNLRLGLWIPNVFQIRGDREERGRSRAAGRIAWLRRRLCAPGPLAVVREALGRMSMHHRLLFISDGGHWDNSGIVELLRRRCTVVFALDASIDSARLSNTLRMMSLARQELGVEFDADAELLTSEEPVKRIRYRFPDDCPRRTPPRWLVLMRTFIVDEMPTDIVALGRGAGPFPRHSTLNQFFSVRESDAYIALGRWLLRRAVRVADLRPAAERPAEVGPPNGGYSSARIPAWS
jgi:hypothetical protein